MIYFTSDLHLGHAGVIQMQKRPFKSVDEMNRALIMNYNSVVRPGDTCYILGDLCHKLPVEKANVVIARMNGKKILIRGNHDLQYDQKLFLEILDFKVASFEEHYYALMHYPMLSWPKKEGGSIMLHGHIHADSEYNLNNLVDGNRRYDVGVDANNYYPVSIKQIEEYFRI